MASAALWYCFQTGSVAFEGALVEMCSVWVSGGNVCVDTECFLCSREIKGGCLKAEGRASSHLSVSTSTKFSGSSSPSCLSVIGRRVANPAASEHFNNSIIRPWQSYPLWGHASSPRLSGLQLSGCALTVCQQAAETWQAAQPANSIHYFAPQKAPTWSQRCLFLLTN